MDTYRKINITLSVVTGLIALGTWVYWEYVCSGRNCSLYLIDWVLDPLLWGSIAWAIISGTLMFFPATLFKKWALHVGIIGMLFMVYCVLNTDPRASSFWLDIDRGRAAWASGVIVWFVTALYLLGTYVLSWMKKKTMPTVWYRLLMLVPSAMVMYYFAVL